MRIVLLACLAVCLLLGCAASKRTPIATTKPKEIKPVQVTVMTYNIHAGKGTDGRLDLARIANVIRASGADLVALQEVDKGTKRGLGMDQASELGRLLKMQVVFGKAMDFGGGEFGDAILSRLPIESSRVVPLPWREGGKREPRVAVAAKLIFPGSKLPVEFISTHWDHTGDPTDRLAQSAAIDKTFDSRGPVILAGDFNCELASEPIVKLLENWTLVSGRDDGPTCCGTEQTVKIDHILVKGRWRVLGSKVIDNTLASDHRPVTVMLELVPPPAGRRR